MSEIELIPDSAEKEVDWMLEANASQQAVAAGAPLQEVGKKFSRNVATTIAARVVNMARGVCLVPFLLRHIGLEAYGIWTTAFILVSYVGVTTLGLSSVYIKYVAEFHARKEYDRANSLLSTGLATTIPLCSLIFAAFVVGWDWYSPWLHLPPSHLSDGKEAVLIVLGVFLSSIALNAFGDMLTGMQQIASTQLFTIIAILVEFALIIWLVDAGRGIRGLAEAYLVRVIINDGLTIWWARRKLKWLHLSPRLIRRESLKYVIHFGGTVQFQSMLGIVLVSVERVAALGFINAAAAGLLDVAKKWPVALSSVPMAFFTALLPAAAHVDASLEGEERKRSLRSLYLSGGRYSNLSTAAFVALIVFWAYPIMHVWLGSALPGQPMLIPLFIIFALARQFHMLTGPGTSIMRGAGRIYEEFYFLIPFFVAIAVLLPMAHWMQGSWTPFGIGVAASLATAIAALVLLARMQVVLELSLGQFLREVIGPSLVCYGVAAALAWPVAHTVAQVGRWAGAGTLALAGILYAVVSAGILYRWVLTGEEQRRGAEILRRGLGVLRFGEAAA